jgi:hypothetical protein
LFLIVTLNVLPLRLNGGSIDDSGQMKRKTVNL